MKEWMEERVYMNGRMYERMYAGCMKVRVYE